MGQLIALAGWFALLVTRFQVLTVFLIKIPVFWILCCFDWLIVVDVLKDQNSLLLFSSSNSKASMTTCIFKLFDFPFHSP